MARTSDRLRSKLQAAMLASASEQNSREGGAPFRAVVSSVSADGTKVGIRRLHNASPDGITYPLIAGAYPVAVGDMVWCRHTNGGVVVEGRTKRAGDRNVPDLATNKLERNGSQRMQVGANRFEVDRPGGEEVAVLRDTGGHSGRAVYQAFHGSNGRRGFVGMSPANELLLHNDHGTRVRSGQTHEGPDFVTDGGVTLSSRLSNANGAVGNPNLATNSADSRVVSVLFNGNYANGSVDGRVVSGGSLTGGHLGDRSLGGIKMVLQTVGQNELNDNTRGGDAADWRMRRIHLQTGVTNTVAASASHFHSVSYKQFSRDERLRIARNYRSIQANHGKGAATRVESLGQRLLVLEEAVADLLYMQTYDPDGTGPEERERILDQGGEVAARYRREQLMHHDGPTELDPLDEEEKRRPSRAAVVADFEEQRRRGEDDA